MFNSGHLHGSLVQQSRQPSLAALEEAVRPWRDRVSTLEHNLEEVQRALAQRDAEISELSSRLRAKGLDPVPEVPVAAIAAAVTGVGLPGASPSATLGSLQQRAAAAAVGQPPPPVLRSEVTKQPLPTTLVPRIVPAPDAAGCEFQEGVDYVSDGREELVEHQNPESCCSLCKARNKDKPGTCAVGVLSSEHDRPPHACWLKERVHHAVAKQGVRACWPPGHPPIPQHPAVADKVESKAHQERLSALPSALSGVNADDATLRKRADAIRDGMRHAWGAYKNLAWGKDELKPVAARGVELKFHHAITMVDALDTLWIMGLREEFDDAKAWLAQNMPARIKAMNSGASMFETTIRTFGGLLSAYHLSQDKVFLDLSLQLGHRIIEKVGSNGVAPYTFSGGNGASQCRSLAESGTNQLEMRYLSHVSGDRSFANKVEQFYTTLREKPNIDGLYPNCFMNGRGKVTLGADGDSFYEYLLKVWVQGGREEEELWKMFDAAADGMEKHLIRKGPDGLTYLGNLMWGGGATEGAYMEEMEHLVCFVPGWLALGAASEQGSAKRDKRMQLAAELANTCWQMYHQQPTGIGPERVKKMKMDLSATDTKEYILRPEAIEGWFYMRELTGEPKYREWGWQTFLAFEKYLWVKNGYASLKNVRDPGKGYLDKMESFFFAETLKYLYLLQSPDHEIKLDRYVFNTEAHPLPILK